MTSLIYAASNGYLDTIVDLVRDGNDINGADANGTTPLLAAIGNGQPHVVMYLLSIPAIDINKGDVTGFRPLFSAIRAKNHEVIMAILQRPDLDINAVNSGGDTALIYAVDDYPMVVDDVIARGVFLDAQQEQTNVTALHLACVRRNVYSALSIIAAGANIHLKDDQLATALHLAVYMNCFPIVEELLSHGASTSEIDEVGRTPLHVVAIELEASTEYDDEKVRIIRILLKHGADIEARDNFQETPLFTVIRDGNAACITEMLRRGSNLDTINLQGQTPRDLAQVNGTIHLLDNRPIAQTEF